MANLAVLTDSTASIPEHFLECLHIHTVADYVHCGQEVLCDVVTIQREATMVDDSPLPSDYH